MQDTTDVTTIDPALLIPKNAQEKDGVCKFLQQQTELSSDLLNKPENQKALKSLPQQYQSMSTTPGVNEAFKQYRQEYMRRNCGG